jgi:AraC family transcriptional regulator, transcriptional activator of pobA
MNDETKPVIVNRIYDLYKNLGASIERLDDKTEFFICNLADYGLGVKEPFEGPVYRANFFSFVFAKDCSGTTYSEHYTFDIQPGSIYFNNPGELKRVVLKDVKELYMATLTESFLKLNVHPAIFEEFSFLLAEIVPPKVLSKQQFAEFEILYRQLIKEFNSDSPYRFKLIGHLCVIMLIKIKEYFWNDYNPMKEGSRSSQIVKNFKRLLETHYRHLNKGLTDKVFRIQEYAQALHLHPNYLNTVIKSKTGKPVGAWIIEKTIVEAKSLLSNSDISIKEVAWRLGFEEAPHFSNYFKKYVSVSPVLYRKNSIAS